MKKNFILKYILGITVMLLLNIFNISYSQEINRLYEKIDLFGEVLEKI